MRQIVLDHVAFSFRRLISVRELHARVHHNRAHAPLAVSTRRRPRRGKLHSADPGPPSCYAACEIASTESPSRIENGRVLNASTLLFIVATR